MTPFDIFTQWIWAPITTIVAWMLWTINEHSKSIVRLDATTVPTEVIRAIIKDETRGLHEDNTKFRTELREDMKELRELMEAVRKDLGKSRATD